MNHDAMLVAVTCFKYYSACQMWTHTLAYMFILTQLIAAVHTCLAWRRGCA